jgi:hypothetical protein
MMRGLSGGFYVCADVVFRLKNWMGRWMECAQHVICCSTKRDQVRLLTWMAVGHPQLPDKRATTVPTAYTSPLESHRISPYKHMDTEQ